MKVYVAMVAVLSLFIGVAALAKEEGRKPSSDFKLNGLEFSNGAKVESVLRASQTSEGDMTFTQITDDKNGVVCYAVSKSISCVKAK